MRIIPVLDLKNGLVVRGIGGRRDEYRPVESVVARTADPIDVAISLREHFGFREFYIADLDAIAGGPPHRDVLHDLATRDLQLLVDAGLRDVAAGRALLDAGATRVIAALETSPGPEQLSSLLNALGPERVTFSLDMQAGKLMTSGNGWLTNAEQPSDTLAVSPDSVAAGLPPSIAAGLPTVPHARPQVSQTDARQPAGCTPTGVAARVLACGVRSLILLDLAGVGEGRGVPTLDLCRTIRALAPDLEIITGGGVRNNADLEALATAGADGVLIASALHNGTLTPIDCARWLG